MSGLSTIKACIVALTLLVYWTGHDILDLSSGLVHILPQIWFIFHLGLLPGTSLLNRLPVFLWLKFVLAVIICGAVVVHRLVLPFCNESLVH